MKPPSCRRHRRPFHFGRGVARESAGGPIHRRISATHIAGDTWRFDYGHQRRSQRRPDRLGRLPGARQRRLVNHTVPASYYGLPGTGRWGGCGLQRLCRSASPHQPAAPLDDLVGQRSPPPSIRPAGRQFSTSRWTTSNRPKTPAGRPRTGPKLPDLRLLPPERLRPMHLHTTALPSPAPVRNRDLRLMLAGLGVLGRFAAKA